ncbi:aromatic acid exporter family protein [Vagococcus fluvialis]|uniref:aromatic acid exporter family protein n=1 Tax=Vagococcus fluvialis TaxID=2738 RepID=UPI001A8F90FF|nr:aromatic acid exporter family protein [Vagococcus fluvialis]MBO0437829.1 aromatic acid exporter family protein [Vagococcus fluvialis]
MKIGLRTIKTVVTATLGIIIATTLGLKFPSTAGIIAILSVTNTKTSSFKVGLGRIIALFIAIIIAFICYSILGYTPIAFGLFLLIYIPIAARFNMSEAIPVNSVLITHFLNEGNMSLSLIINAVSLLLIGVGLALIANLYMPNVQGSIDTNKEKVDLEIKELLLKMSAVLSKKTNKINCEKSLENIEQSIDQGESYAKRHFDNHLLRKDDYEVSYFQMRRMQLNVLQDMVELVGKIEIEHEIVEAINVLIKEIYDTYGEKNDGKELNDKVSEVIKYYETKELPKTRIEFENRARLFQFLTEIQTFIHIKVNFNLVD